MIRNKGIAFRLIFSILASCTVIFIAIFGYNYFLTRKIIIRNIEDNAKNITLATVNKIETVLRPIEKVPLSIAYSLEHSSYGREDLVNLLRSLIENNPEVYGSAIAFEPYAFDKDAFYFAPYFYRNAEGVKLNYLGSDNYKYFNWDWYQMPKELKGPVWSEPYYDEGAGNIVMSTYSVPFYRTVNGERKFTGVVTADVSLLWLQEIVSSIKIAQTGYGFLISRNGRIVTHPIKPLIMNETIFDLAEAKRDSRLRKIGREMIMGKSGVELTNSIVTGKKCWLVFTPLVTNGWSLGIVFPQDELIADIIRLNKIVFFLGVIGFLFLLTVIVLISRSITRPLRTLAALTRDIAGGNLEFDLPSPGSKDEVGKLADSFIYMRDALKKYIKELTETVASKERIESELRIAHDIQMGIVPKEFPPFPGRKEFDIYALLEPAKEVGGDFYDFFFIDSSHFCFVIGDVSDKGVPAALFMAMTKTLIKATAIRAGGPDEILNKVNKEIFSENESCMFITIFFGIMDTQTGEVYYVNAGHNPPLLVRENKDAGFFGSAEATAVGVEEGTAYKKEKIVLCPGDVIYLYTDGVTEAFNSKRELFSDERLKDCVGAYAGKPVQEMVKGVLQEIRAFAQGAPQSDDITIMALKYFSGIKKGDGGFGESEKSITLRNDISEIPQLVNAWFEFAEENNLSDAVINDLRLAVEEAVSNVIFYAYADKNEHHIDINFNLKGGQVILTVTDDGKAFNPLEYPVPDIDKPMEERQIGGLGIYLIRNSTDGLEYRREEGKNILVMKKRALSV
jgi:phosphoserine phosphatase RsbU/P